LHQDKFLPKVSWYCLDAASANATSLYCRAVRWHSPQSPTLITLENLSWHHSSVYLPGLSHLPILS